MEQVFTDINGDQKAQGFTLLELVVCMFIMAIMTVIATPIMLNFTASADYRDAAQIILQTLKEARSQAVNQNIEYAVDFDMSTDSFQLSRGNLSANSTSFTQLSSVSVASTVTLRGTDDCDDASDLTIIFRPDGSATSNGSATTATICIKEASAAGNERYKVSLSNPSTSRVIID